MTVRVRLFAAIREAAGEAETEVAPGRLDEILEELCHRYGARFAERLAQCAVLVDGSAVTRGAGASVVVPAGAEVALLPPVSGGSS